MVRRIELTSALRDAIEAVRVAAAVYEPGEDPASLVELPKLALADAVLEALRAQALDLLPTRADVVYVQLEPKHGRRPA